jgi:hypothetical protein
MINQKEYGAKLSSISMSEETHEMSAILKPLTLVSEEVPLADLDQLSNFKLQKHSNIYNFLSWVAQDARMLSVKMTVFWDDAPCSLV